MLERHEPVDLDAARRRAQPDDIATVIYTSGTTGPPKGVMLDHANIVWTVESAAALPGPHRPHRACRLVSYLPMAHIAERMTRTTRGSSARYEVTTCPEPRLVGQYLPEVRPEIFFAVPRVWEKIHAGVLAVGRRRPRPAGRARRRAADRGADRRAPGARHRAFGRSRRRVRGAPSRRSTSCRRCSGSTRSLRRSAEPRRSRSKC